MEDGVLATLLWMDICNYIFFIPYFYRHIKYDALCLEERGNPDNHQSFFKKNKWTLGIASCWFFESSVKRSKMRESFYKRKTISVKIPIDFFQKFAQSWYCESYILILAFFLPDTFILVFDKIPTFCIFYEFWSRFWFWYFYGAYICSERRSRWWLFKYFFNFCQNLCTALFRRQLFLFEKVLRSFFLLAYTLGQYLRTSASVT